MKIADKMEMILDNINLEAYSKTPYDIEVIEYFGYIKNTDDFEDLDGLIKKIWSLITVDSRIYTTSKIAKLLNIKIDKGNLVHINKHKFVKINPLLLDFYEVKRLLYSIFRMDIVEHFFIFIDSQCVVYPHEDFWFGIIDKNVNKSISSELLNTIDNTKCSIFITGNRN